MVLKVSEKREREREEKNEFNSEGLWKKEDYCRPLTSCVEQVKCCQLIHSCLSPFRSTWETHLHVTCVTRKQTLRSLSLSYLVIPKERWARVAAPILLLVWHRLFRISKVGFRISKVGPSFGMTTKETLWSVFSWCASCVAGNGSLGPKTFDFTCCNKTLEFQHHLNKLNRSHAYNMK